MTTPPSAAEIVEALVAGLLEHVADLERAEERRAAFAFDERPRAARSASARDGRHHARAALAAAADPLAFRLLMHLRSGPLPFEALCDLVSERSDAIATASIVDALAGAGLVARELTADDVRLTTLGAAIVDLLDELGARLESADLPATTGGGVP